MTKDLTATAAQCADTQFIIGGYSQGASVTDIAVGANGAQSLGRGTAIPANLASRIKAVVVFGNPLSGFAGSTLEKASATFGARTKSFCGTSDPICGGDRNGNGNVSGNHLSYTTNGALDQAATFAAGKITG
jgi:cutinase